MTIDLPAMTIDLPDDPQDAYDLALRHAQSLCQSLSDVHTRPPSPDAAEYYRGLSHGAHVCATAIELLRTSGVRE